MTFSPWSGRQPGELALGGTVRGRVVDVLRARILSGQLPRGYRLDLDQLAAEFGTSRTPVREAILALDQEGLAHVAPRSRATVVGLTPQDVRDNFTLMAVLSGLAAELAAHRASDAELATIVELGLVLDGAEGEALDRGNYEFHRAVNRASAARPLLIQLRTCSKLIPQHLIPEQAPNSRAEHRELVDAFRLRNGARARDVMERHFRAAGELLSGHHAGTTDDASPV